MTDCFKTRAPNAAAAVPTPMDTGSAGYFQNFSNCDADDGTPLSADWLNNLIVNLEAVVAAAVAVEPGLNVTDCDDILARALPFAAGCKFYRTSVDSSALIDAAKVGSMLHDDEAGGTGRYYMRVPNDGNDVQWVASFYGPQIKT